MKNGAKQLKYFSLSTTVRLGEDEQLRLEGKADNIIRPTGLFCNAADFNMFYLTDMNFGSNRIACGFGLVDVFSFKLANMLKLEMGCVVMPDVKISYYGLYTGRVPPGGIIGSTYIFNVTLQCLVEE